LYGLENDVIAGLTANILGLSFVMMVEPPDMEKSLSLKTAKYRPGSIQVSVRGVINRIDISWEDHRAHDTVSLTFLGNVQP
jgi:hypothetical protein